jgi:hypothetical protein
LEEDMQQSPLATYADIGWVLLGVYPITAVAEMTPREADGEGERKQDIQRYVRRLVGYVVGKRREYGCLKNHGF